MDGDYIDPNMYGDMDPEMMYEMMQEGDYMDEAYYDDEGNQFGWDNYDQQAQMFLRIPFGDLLDQCILPTLSQAVSTLLPLLGLCFIHRLTYSVYADSKSEESSLPVWILHAMSIILGGLAAHMFFQGAMLYVLCLAVLTYSLLYISSVAKLQGQNGLLVSTITVVFLLTCELVVVEQIEWHRVRGAQMVAAMKIISVAFDLDMGLLPRLPGVLQFAGYVMHPGTIIFGPWISFHEYTNVDFHSKKRFSGYWVMKCVGSLLAGLLCVVCSTCIVPWIILDSWGKWYAAYRDAQSFRFSHYFISFTSEATTVISGLGSSKANGDVRWDLSVTRPFHIEFPRSLVEVVTNWNLPMHYWLKTYVFKTARPLGSLPAVILTYAASSLLHGLNFQLSAVLFSLGFYSYIEYVFRAKLSKIFDACIQAKKCKACSHVYTSFHPYVIGTNLLFGALTVFHLAYLGLMFDSSESEDQGYTMTHTLGKWAGLDYASHLVAMGTCLVYLLI